jgi:spore germination protein GerM
MRRRLTTISGMLVALVVACGIPADGQVGRMQDSDLGPLDDTIPTTITTIPPTTIEPTTTTTLADTPTTIPTEDVTLYFISGGILVEYARSLPKRASPGQVLALLQEGPPSGELGAGLRTALPTRNQALLNVTEDGSGVATVNLPVDFFEEVKQEDQRVAIGQIVLTLTEVGRIGQVRFTQNGQAIGVPRGSGDLSEQGQPLAHRDYQELLQAPGTTTTTTPTTTTVA